MYVMKRFIFYIGLLLLCCVSLTAQSIKIGKGIEEYTAEERPWIWWFWLGNIVSEDLIDQHLTAYSKAGYGGVVVISTYGVKGYEQQQIQYRSSEWYKMIQYVVRKADQLGMKVDIALSSAWPFGGKQVNRTDGARFLKRLETMKCFGIQGLECYYSRYNQKEIKFLVKCAENNNLLISGGSDYHGTNKDIPLARLNSDNVPIDAGLLSVVKYIQRGVAI